MPEASLTLGVHHVGLTVPDVVATSAFFTQVLGFRTVAERPDYPAVFVSDGAVLLTLWQAEDPASARPFDRKHCIGLHHLALRVANRDALLVLHERLRKTANVKIEFAPEPLGDSPTEHMMCAIPGGLRVEFIAPATP